MSGSSGFGTTVRFVVGLGLGAGIAYGVKTLVDPEAGAPWSALLKPAGLISLTLLGFATVIVISESFRLMRSWLNRGREGVRYPIDNAWDAWRGENERCLTSHAQDALQAHREDAEALTNARWRPYYLMVIAAAFPIFLSQLNQQDLVGTNAYIPWNSSENSLLWVTGCVVLLTFGLWLLRLGWSKIWQSWETRRSLEWSANPTPKTLAIEKSVQGGTIATTVMAEQGQGNDLPVKKSETPRVETAVTKKLHFQPSTQRSPVEPQGDDDSLFEPETKNEDD